MRFGLRLPRAIVIALAALGITACGDDASTEQQAQQAIAENSAPSISGQMNPIAIEGEDYYFKPSAADRDGDAMLFIIDGKPKWANFDESTGELTGKPGKEDRGKHQGIVISVTDGENTASLDPQDIEVVEGTTTNQPPLISGTPAGSVTVGEFYDFIPVASDPDGDPISFTIQNQPPWSDFDPVIGRMSGTPGSGDVDDYGNVIISVTDGVATTALDPFVVVVNPVPSTNTPPQISGQPATSVLIGEDYSFTPDASDADGDTLTFDAINLPVWALIDAATGAISGTPAELHTGMYTGISVVASDGEAQTALTSFSIEVIDPNEPPVISGTPAATVAVGEAYSFLPAATDADADSLSFSVAGLPSWAGFNTTNGALSGTPAVGDVGTWANISITVTDGKADATLGPFSIEVTAINSAPFISGSPQLSVIAGSDYSFVPSASDADGDILSFSVANLPSWAWFDIADGSVGGVPLAGDVGIYPNVSITVTDGQDDDTLGPFSIEVIAVPNAAPVISGTPSGSVTAGEAYSFVPSASDPDGDGLSFSVSGLPVWAGFDPATGAISGTPTAADAGVYASISITVTDGLASATLGPFAIEVTQIATGSATLSWTPPTENTDGSTLIDLKGYKIYWGTASGDYSNSVAVENAGLTSYVVDNLQTGTTYYFATTAYNNMGVESAFSNEAIKLIQ